jgi:hypothetical protein
MCWVRITTGAGGVSNFTKRSDGSCGRPRAIVSMSFVSVISRLIMKAKYSPPEANVRHRTLGGNVVALTAMQTQTALDANGVSPALARAL